MASYNICIVSRSHFLGSHGIIFLRVNDQETHQVLSSSSTHAGRHAVHCSNSPPSARWGLHALELKLDNNYLLLHFADAEAVANFINEACATGGVKPSDPLLFTCEVNGAVLLRVGLPTGQEIISLGDTPADVILPTGFTAVSLDIIEIDESTRNFTLTLAIDRAFRLEGGNITCDNTTSVNTAMDGCLIGKLSPPSNCSLLHCYLSYH